MSVSVPTIFIPALLCDDLLYEKLIGILGADIRAQVMMSPLPSLADSAADILARAPDQFVLVGTSYGGNLALEIALAAPERVTALWLMGCDPGAPQPGSAQFADSLAAAPEAITDMLAGLVVRTDDTESAAAFRTMAGRVGGNAGAAQARALACRNDLRARLGELTMPTLVTSGADDALVAPSVGREMAAGLSNAHFHLIEECGHLPTLERPQASAALFQAFLAAHL